jgi:hypothetical protein
MIGSRLGTISAIEPLRVYLNSLDIYPEDDTLSIICYTVIRDTTVIVPPGINPIEGINGFFLGQNIPNPANNATLINYSVPEAGEVIFYVHSISGQLLYSKTIEVG